ncbi:hypothetical protein BGZ99_002051, partial [Dissophora globulifera]
EEIRAHKESIRKITDTREYFCLEEFKTLTITFDKQHYLSSEVAPIIRDSFPTVVSMDDTNQGVLVLSFGSKDETDAIHAAPLPACPIPIQLHRTMQSIGTQIHIRVDDPMLLLAEERIKELDRVFGEYGRIIHLRFDYLKDTPVLFPSFSFTLELKEGSPPDVMIPRIAYFGGRSPTLFHWRGYQYCHRCGSDAHIKRRCPYPQDHQPRCGPSPILARAFLPPNTSTNLN